MREIVLTLRESACHFFAWRVQERSQIFIKASIKTLTQFFENCAKAENILHREFEQFFKD